LLSGDRSAERLGGHDQAEVLTVPWDSETAPAPVGLFQQVLVVQAARRRNEYNK